jgi:hypothetical protein
MQVERSASADSGARVSNTYTTCPILGDSIGKLVVIPHSMSGRHLLDIKDLLI